MARTRVTRILILIAMMSSGIEAQVRKVWDSMTNPKISIPIEHPPSLPLRVTRVAFGESEGPCGGTIKARVEEDFFSNGVEVLDRSRLDAVIAEMGKGGSVLFDPATAIEVGKLLQAEALVYIRTLKCKAERSEHHGISIIAGKQNITYTTTGTIEGSLRITDLTTGRWLTAKSFEGRASESSKSGYPSQSAALEAAERDAIQDIHAMFFPWTETKTLVFFNDEKCNLKAAHSLLRAQDFTGALVQSEANLEICRSLAGEKLRTLAHAYYNLGIVHFLMGTYEQGSNYLSEAAKLDGSQVITEALAECRKAEQIASQMAAYEINQAAYLAEINSGAGIQEPSSRVTPNSPPVKSNALSPPKSQGSIEGRLKQLEDLFKKGLITKQDYEKKKAEILAEL